jgi:PIN domain nuclease of toxin-antitoxin system
MESVNFRSNDIAGPGNDVFASTVSLFEIMVKVRTGKLRVDMKELIEGPDLQGFQLLPLTERHVMEMEKLPVHADHKDPFDHQLIAQAIAEDMFFLSFDRHAGRYPVKLLS